MYLRADTDGTCPQHLLPLFTDILQYYLACSPRATNPFQQVRARLVLGGQGQRETQGAGRGRKGHELIL